MKPGKGEDYGFAGTSRGPGNSVSVGTMDNITEALSMPLLGRFGRGDRFEFTDRETNR